MGEGQFQGQIIALCDNIRSCSTNLGHSARAAAMAQEILQ